MELTCRVYRKLRLIYGNNAKTLNPASFRRSVSGLVERWVSGFMSFAYHWDIWSSKFVGREATSIFVAIRRSEERALGKEKKE